MFPSGHTITQSPMGSLVIYLLALKHHTERKCKFFIKKEKKNTGKGERVHS